MNLDPLDLKERLRKVAECYAEYITFGVGQNPSDYLEGQAADYIEQLEQALQSFLQLSWEPGDSPEPSYYCVYPIDDAHNTIREASMLLTGMNPFPAEQNGSVSCFSVDNENHYMVWLDGMAYAEKDRDLVKPEHLELFDQALANAKSETARSG